MAGRVDAPSLRAVAGLVLAVAAPSLIILYASELDGALASLAGAAEDGTGAWLDCAIATLMLLLAMLGSVLLAQPIKPGWRAPGLIVSALPVGITALAATLALAAAAGAVTYSNGKIASFALFLAGTLLIAIKASSEELLFRGFLQPLLCRAWGPMTAIIVASLAFTAIHIAGGWRDPVSLLNIALAGGWFGLLAWRTGGVLAPILAHAGYNWAEEMLFGASPNPGIGGFGALFDVDLTGPARLAGSADGLNASLLLTAVLTAMILPLVLRWPMAEAAITKRKTGPSS